MKASPEEIAHYEKLARERGGRVGSVLVGPMIEPQTATVLSSDISEKDFMAKVIAYAKSRGWKVYHTYRSDKSEPGYLDLTMVRGGTTHSAGDKITDYGVVWAELKTETGKLTKAQKEWIKALEAADQEVHVWRPSDWPEIERVLR